MRKGKKLGFETRGERTPTPAPLKTLCDLGLYRNWCQWQDLNLRPRAYESPALPLSYTGNQKGEHFLEDRARCQISKSPKSVFVGRGFKVASALTRDRFQRKDARTESVSNVVANEDRVRQRGQRWIMECKDRQIHF